MSNPFNKLKVERDDEEFVTVQSNKNDTLFPKDGKPKKKVRQEDSKTETKEETVNHNDNEGFVTVGKVKKYNNNNYKNSDVEVVESKPGKGDNHNKRFHDRREDVHLRQGTHQRLFDKHSGTGYDKTIKKQGRGGKYTWEGQGREVVDYSTDYYFNKALNPQKYEKVVEVTKEEVKVEPKVEEVVQEDTTNTEQVVYDKKKKGGPTTTPEEDEKNKLVIPENAIRIS